MSFLSPFFIRPWPLGLLLALVQFAPSTFSQPVPLDFSTAGYAANEKPIPAAPVRVVVKPTSGDSTARIQAAIDYVSHLAADTNSLRGAVLLLAGRHEVLGGLSITNSGVVLRGQGVNETTLVAAGLDRRTLIRIHGSPVPAPTQRIPITDPSVPVGANTISVTDASTVRPLSPIRLTRPSTKEWITQLRATDFGGGEGGCWPTACGAVPRCHRRRQ